MHALKLSACLGWGEGLWTNQVAAWSRSALSHGLGATPWSFIIFHIGNLSLILLLSNLIGEVLGAVKL